MNINRKELCESWFTTTFGMLAGIVTVKVFPNDIPGISMWAFIVMSVCIYYGTQLEDEENKKKNVI